MIILAQTIDNFRDSEGYTWATNDDRLLVQMKQFINDAIYTISSSTSISESALKSKIIEPLRKLWYDYNPELVDGSQQNKENYRAQQKTFFENIILGKTKNDQIAANRGLAGNFCAHNTSFLAEEIAANEDEYEEAQESETTPRKKTVESLYLEDEALQNCLNNITESFKLSPYPDFEDNEDENSQQSKLAEREQKNSTQIQNIKDLYKIAKGDTDGTKVLQKLSTLQIIPDSLKENDKIKSKTQEIAKSLAAQQKAFDSVNEDLIKTNVQKGTAEKASILRSKENKTEEERQELQALEYTLEHPEFAEDIIQHESQKMKDSLLYSSDVSSLLRSSVLPVFADYSPGGVKGTNADIYNDRYGTSADRFDFDDETKKFLLSELIEEVIITAICILLSPTGAGEAGYAGFRVLKGLKTAVKGANFFKKFSTFGKVFIKHIGKKYAAKFTVRSGKAATKATIITAKELATGGIKNVLKRGSIYLIDLGVEGVGFHVSGTIIHNALEGKKLSEGLNPLGTTNGVPNWKAYLQSIAYLGVLKALGSPIQSGIGKLFGTSHPTSRFKNILQHTLSLVGEMGSLYCTDQILSLTFDHKFKSFTGADFVQMFGMVLGLRLTHKVTMKIQEYDRKSVTIEMKPENSTNTYQVKIDREGNVLKITGEDANGNKIQNPESQLGIKSGLQGNNLREDLKQPKPIGTIEGNAKNLKNLHKNDIITVQHGDKTLKLQKNTEGDWDIYDNGGSTNQQLSKGTKYIVKENPNKDGYHLETKGGNPLKISLDGKISVQFTAPTEVYSSSPETPSLSHEQRITTLKQYSTSFYNARSRAMNRKHIELHSDNIRKLTEAQKIEDLTMDDIKAIQKEIGLTGTEVDGIIGPKTVEQLKIYLNSENYMALSRQAAQQRTEIDAKQAELDRAHGEIENIQQELTNAQSSLEQYKKKSWETREKLSQTRNTLKDAQYNQLKASQEYSKIQQRLKETQAQYIKNTEELKTKQEQLTALQNGKEIINRLQLAENISKWKHDYKNGEEPGGVWHINNNYAAKYQNGRIEIFHTSDKNKPEKILNFDIGAKLKENIHDSNAMDKICLDAAEQICLEIENGYIEVTVSQKPHASLEERKAEAQKIINTHQELDMVESGDKILVCKKATQAKELELSQEVSSLQQTTQAFKQRIDTLTQQSKDLLLKIQEIEHTIQTSTSEISDYESANRQLQKTLTQIRTKIKELESKNNSSDELQQELEKLKQELEATQNAIDNLSIGLPEGPAERASAKAEEKSKTKTTVEEKNKRKENPEVGTKTPEDIDFSSKEGITKLFESVENLDLEQVQNICEKAYQQNYVKGSNFNGQGEFILENSSISYQINYLNGKPCGLRIHDYQNKTKTYYKYENGKKTQINREDYVNIRSEAMKKCHREINRFNNETPEEISAFLNTLSNTKDVKIVDLKKASNMLEYVSDKDLAQAIDLINKAQKRFIESYGDVNSHLYRPKIEAAQKRLDIINAPKNQAEYTKKQIEALKTSKDFEKDSEKISELLKKYEKQYGKDSPRLKELQESYQKVLETHTNKALNDANKEQQNNGNISAETDKKLSTFQKIIEKTKDLCGRISESLQRLYDGILHLRFYFKLGSKSGIQVGGYKYQLNNGELLKIDKSGKTEKLQNATAKIKEIRREWNKLQAELKAKQKAEHEAEALKQEEHSNDKSSIDLKSTVFSAEKQAFQTEKLKYYDAITKLKDQFPDYKDSFEVFTSELFDPHSTKAQIETAWNDLTTMLIKSLEPGYILKEKGLFGTKWTVKIDKDSLQFVDKNGKSLSTKKLQEMMKNGNIKVERKKVQTSESKDGTKGSKQINGNEKTKKGELRNFDYEKYKNDYPELLEGVTIGKATYKLILDENNVIKIEGTRGSEKFLITEFDKDYIDRIKAAKEAFEQGASELQSQLLDATSKKETYQSQLNSIRSQLSEINQQINGFNELQTQFTQKQTALQNFRRQYFTQAKGKKIRLNGDERHCEGMKENGTLQFKKYDNNENFTISSFADFSKNLIQINGETHQISRISDRNTVQQKERKPGGRIISQYEQGNIDFWRDAIQQEQTLLQDFNAANQALAPLKGLQVQRTQLEDQYKTTEEQLNLQKAFIKDINQQLQDLDVKPELLDAAA